MLCKPPSCTQFCTRFSHRSLTTPPLQMTDRMSCVADTSSLMIINSVGNTTNLPATPSTSDGASGIDVRLLGRGINNTPHFGILCSWPWLPCEARRFLPLPILLAKRTTHTLSLPLKISGALRLRNPQRFNRNASRISDLHSISIQYPQ